ncbi:hypothetical protein HYV50_05340 [Candidatus Pacearchaeota archaeon]|nr:hypothetical protein [Candidatus Pacearchaeota archaeon]
MPFKNIERRREYRREWYISHKKSEKKYVRIRKKKIREWIEHYKKSLKCKVCSENHPAVIEFHHKKDKKFEISYMVANGYSIPRIREELEKCEVLCANCHRKRHYKKDNL